MTRVCDVTGCDAQSYGKGYCERHYTRLRRHGNVMGGTSPSPVDGEAALALHRQGLSYTEIGLRLNTSRSSARRAIIRESFVSQAASGKRSRPDANWHARAACRGQATKDHDPWYPDGDDTDSLGWALAVCRTCPVRPECADAGRDERYGVWGGIPPKYYRAQS